MAEPPPYSKGSYGQGQEYVTPVGQVYGAPGQGFVAPGQGFAAPGQGFADTAQGYAAPGPGYGAPVATRVMFSPSSTFGPESVITVCRNCQANVSRNSSTDL